jgi:hypothetical protein
MSLQIDDVAQIFKDLTGNSDSTDVTFINSIYPRLNRFIQYNTPSQVMDFPYFSWFQFTTVDGVEDYPVNLNDGTSPVRATALLQPPAYTFDTSGQQMQALQFMMDPALFYNVWPQLQPQPNARPNYVLYYNNVLKLRPIPDDAYPIQISCYNIPLPKDEGENLDFDYWYRYIAYGAGLDYFADIGDYERWNTVLPIFNKYKADVLARVTEQLNTGRAQPRF